MKLKNEKKALQMFCEEDAWRDVYKEPFINEADNGRLMAAEGHIMIRWIRLLDHSGPLE